MVIRYVRNVSNVSRIPHNVIINIDSCETVFKNVQSVF